MRWPSVAQFYLVSARAVAILALLLSGVFLHHLANFSARCYSSQIIDRFVLFSEQEEVPNCKRAFTDWSFEGSFSSPVARVWDRWTRPLDLAFETWPSKSKGLQLIHLSSEPFIYFREGRSLLLGSEWFQSKRLWSNIVLSHWVYLNHQAATDLEVALIGEFLVSLTQGRHELVGLDRSQLQEDEIVWSTVGGKATDYCDSVWRRPEELDHCETGHGEELRPLLSRALWRVYHQASWRGRRTFLQWLQNKVARGEESLLLAQPDPQDVIEWMQSEITRWVEKTNDLNQNRRSQRVSFQLGLHQALQPSVVVVGPPPTNLHLEEQDFLAFRQSDELTWISAKRRISATLKDVRPQHAVLLSCQKPKLQELKNMAENTVLVVQACDSSSLEGWSLLAQNQLKAFIAHNFSVPVMWINVADLRQELNQRGLRPHSHLSLRQLRKSSRWREDHWDGATRAFVPKAVRDLILSHRASSLWL